MEFMKTGLSETWKLQQRNDLEVGELEQLAVQAGRLAMHEALCGSFGSAGTGRAPRGISSNHCGTRSRKAR